MMMKLTKLALAAALAVTAMVPSIAQADDVAVSYVTAPFNVPSIVMRKLGYLDQAFADLGVTLTHPEITSGADQTNAIAAGQLQVASVLGGTSAILARANGADVAVMGAYARSPKAYFVMAAEGGPTDIASLRGKKIAGPKGTTLNQLLAAALASEGMTLDDVDYINMDLPTARAALISGQVDAATLAGANATQVEEANGHVITNGEGLIAPTNVISTSKAFAEAHPDYVAAYFKAHMQAIAYMAENTEDAIKIAAEEQGISIAEASKQFGWYDFNPQMSDADVANLEADQDFMIEAGMLEESARIDIKADLILPSAFDIQ